MQCAMPVLGIPSAVPFPPVSQDTPPFKRQAPRSTGTPSSGAGGADGEAIMQCSMPVLGVPSAVGVGKRRRQPQWDDAEDLFEPAGKLFCSRAAQKGCFWAEARSFFSQVRLFTTGF